MSLPKDPFNVIIAGVGGQGNVLASLLLGQLFVARGYKATIGETYGVSQRGGSVMSHLRLSEKIQYSPIIPAGLGDLVISLEPIEGLRMLEIYGHPDVAIITNTRPVSPMSVLTGARIYPQVELILETIMRYSRKFFSVDATEVALSLGNPILANVALLGAVEASGILPFNQGELEEVMRMNLSAQHLELNLKALVRGRDALNEFAD